MSYLLPRAVGLQREGFAVDRATHAADEAATISERSVTPEAVALIQRFLTR